jgi:hypothetical protein
MSDEALISKGSSSDPVTPTVSESKSIRYCSSARTVLSRKFQAQDERADLGWGAALFTPPRHCLQIERKDAVIRSLAGPEGGLRRCRQIPEKGYLLDRMRLTLRRRIR